MPHDPRYLDDIIIQLGVAQKPQTKVFDPDARIAALERRNARLAQKVQEQQDVIARMSAERKPDSHVAWDASLGMAGDAAARYLSVVQGKGSQ